MAKRRKSVPPDLVAEDMLLAQEDVAETRPALAMAPGLVAQNLALVRRRPRKAAAGKAKTARKPAKKSRKAVAKTARKPAAKKARAGARRPRPAARGRR